jgi:hypothetical protein
MSVCEEERIEKSGDLRERRVETSEVTGKRAESRRGTREEREEREEREQREQREEARETSDNK